MYVVIRHDHSGVPICDPNGKAVITLSVATKTS